MARYRTLVWDPLVRIFHGCVAVAFIANYFLTEAGEAWHERIGYGAVAWVLVRAAWGFIGAGAARWSQFWPTPSRLRAHVRQLRQRAGHEGLGHSPIGAVVMILLMASTLALGTTGYLLQETDIFFGSKTLQEVHACMANSMLALVAVHIAAAVLESLRLRENLPLSMVTGYRIVCSSDQDSRAEAHPTRMNLLGLALAATVILAWLWVVLR